MLVATPTSEKGPGESGAFTLADLLSILISLFVISLLVFIVWRITREVRSIGETVSDEEKAFAAQMAEITKLGQTDPASAGASSAMCETPIPASATPATPPPAVAAPGAPGNPVEDLARRLVALRIVTEREGRLPVVPPPEGLIYRLRRGGVCAILPRQESADAMEHYCRRFDMIFVPLPGGEILTYERLQNRIPDLVDSPTSMH